MLRRFPLLRTLAFALLAFSSVPAWQAWSQVRIPAEAVTDEAALREVFQQGQRLERERRWGEALSHYEQALKEHPGVQALEQRVHTARMHFDLARRYSDLSFTRSLDAMSPREALDVYAEVLLKIQSYYVHSPDWRQLLESGTAQVDVALAEPLFAEHHLPNASAEQRRAARQQLHRVMDGRRIESRHEAQQHVQWAARIVSQQLGIAEQAVIMEYVCGAFCALDPYSAFLSGDRYSETMSQIDGNFVGLGIELRAEDDALLIVDVIRGGPADEAGLLGGDRIVAVNHRTTKDLSTDTAAEMLKGEDGSVVDVTVAGPDGHERTLRLRRRRVDIPSLEDVSILDSEFGIGYIKLTTFQKTTLREMNSALWDLRRQGMRSLIIDVRGNPGGLLEAAVDVADKFVDQGTLVSTRGRNPREDFDHKARQFGTWRVPLVVLVDGDSASASEIFAGAIRDHRRGTIVGRRSYGKGSVQGIFPLNNARAGIRLTTAKFYSPNGHPISSHGVLPDVVVRQTAKPVNGNHEPSADAILEAGVQRARNQLARQSLASP